jgi:hypothetical protein
MKVAQIKSAPQFESRDWRQYGIQTYGDTNDFPQTVSEIVQASKTGNACLSIYNDFVYGHGFKDPGIYKLRVNKEGEKLDKILRMVCKDFTLWHGFAVHVNYNMNFRVSSIHHIPFESLRLAKADDDGFIGRTAYHPTGVTEIRRGPDGHRLTSSGFISSTGSGGYSEPGRRSWRMGQL